MTVAELIAKLQVLPQNARVYLTDWSEGYAPPEECLGVHDMVEGDWNGADIPDGFDFGAAYILAPWGDES